MKNETYVPSQAIHSFPLLINGLSSRINSNGTTISRLDADELKTLPKKFFFFNITSVNEAVLTNAKIELYLNNKYPDGDPLRLIFDSCKVQGKVAGLITGLTINKISLNIYSAGILTHRMKAVSAGILNNNQTVFYNADLEHPPTKRHIISDMIIWDSGSKKFIVPGLYNTSSPLGKSTAKGLQIDLNFDLSPIKKTGVN